MLVSGRAGKWWKWICVQETAWVCKLVYHFAAGLEYELLASGFYISEVGSVVGVNVTLGESQFVRTASECANSATTHSVTLRSALRAVFVDLAELDRLGTLHQLLFLGRGAALHELLVLGFGIALDELLSLTADSVTAMESDEDLLVGSDCLNGFDCLNGVDYLLGFDGCIGCNSFTGFDCRIW